MVVHTAKFVSEWESRFEAYISIRVHRWQVAISIASQRRLAVNDGTQEITVVASVLTFPYQLCTSKALSLLTLEE